MSGAPSPLHVLSLQVDNVLRVAAVYIEPNGRLVEITGKNFQGKSSTLNALWMAFGGEKSVPADPIHDGATEGSVTVQLGNNNGPAFKITRRLRRKEDGTIAQSLTVENAEGHRLAKPQEILNALIGQYTADPLEFLRAKPKDQFDTLKAFVPEVDFDAIEVANTSDYAKRTEFNTRAKSLRAQAAGIALPQQVPAIRTDESALVAELQRAGEHNAEIERQRSARSAKTEICASHVRKADEYAAEAAELRLRADALDAQCRAAQEQTRAAQAELDSMPPLPDPIDPSSISARITQARADNATFDNLVRRNDLIAEAEIAEAQAADLTEAMAKREADKKAAVAAAKMPITGITFGDGAILHNGHPIASASGAQQLRIAVEVAAALNPRLRFVRIKDASLLDDDSWAELRTLCDELDLQVFAETVASGRPGAVVIEDGHVKGAAAVTEASQ